jgi:PTH1 family peptidyl-tRNA hydrolase
MKLIVGLGNPGTEYERTRHNAGFMALDLFAAAHALEWKKDAKRHALIAEGILGEQKFVLAKPQTFMNESGLTVQGFVTFYKQDKKDVLVVHDEMDLEAGRIAFVTNAGHAGHNGVRDIQERLGADGIARLRIGINRPVPPIAKEDWVLGRPKEEEEKRLHNGVELANKAMETWIMNGLTLAMNQWNKK